MNDLHVSSGYELHLRPLYANHRGYAFPCDVQGHVDLDSLSERVYANDLHARATLGRELAWPAVDSRPTH
ncbi:hypothetical protein QTI66_29775 [Variovorax sp. J22R133]|uniref:hypothetical protein n=1 Tax=Variovorax brevis TaxID=3053503 RepID=UPI00257672A0|nr:hypothetical protein [Variovorax sp. J22R133]MDM0116349.1 hypothetical protein [Variovorax sp. J22R133]